VLHVAGILGQLVRKSLAEAADRLVHGLRLILQIQL
jgi:hypothetical protein